jgi:sugar lactone lactonase YvrE
MPRLLAIAASTLALVVASTGFGQATEHRPDSYRLPGDKTFPEGIARAPASPAFFVGSYADGTVFRGDVRAPDPQVFLPPGADGRTSVMGMKVDRAGRLIVAGADTGKVWVYDTRTAALLHTFETGIPGSFVNDVAVAANGDVYVTDSLQPRLYRIAAAELAVPGTTALGVFRDLRGTAIDYQDGFNLNGIVVTPDQRALVVADYNDRKLYRIDRNNGDVAEIDLGGESVTGDGLLMRGRTLYAVSSEDGDVIDVVDVDGTGTRGRLRERVAHPALLAPSTAAFDGPDLLVVNFQNGSEHPVLPFNVVRIPSP